MSVSATSPDQEVRRLIGEGYDVALADGMLVVSHVPYVRGPGRIGRASLLVPLSMVAGRVSAPRTHQAWWTGKEPTEVDGRPLDGMKAHGSTTRCLEGLPPAIMICCKPRGREFRDHHEFVTTYVGLLGAPAATLDPSVTARFRAPRTSPPSKEGPFAYLDTASPRAALGAVNARVKGRTVGIVGLGGTGSYVLDLVSKCSVGAIHLYDDDLLEQHSAFRAPGATTIDDLRARRTKVDHFASVYRGIHRHVMPHAIRIDGRTAAMLDPLDFVFLCIDDAAAKPPIIERLARRAIPYVDVGMGLHLTDRGIAGAMRTTFVEPGEHAVAESIPTVGDADGVYATNIQICELNALNAALAVIAWKRHLGFYTSNRSQSNSVFVVEDGRLHTDERDAPLVSMHRASGAAAGACPEPDHEDEDA